MAFYPIFVSDKLKIPQKEVDTFIKFLQYMANRKMQGHARYGPIVKDQKYMSRMIKEVKAYKKNGNMEQLLNIAVYCFLESYAPENKKFHFNNTIESITRK